MITRAKARAKSACSKPFGRTAKPSTNSIITASLVYMLPNHGQCIVLPILPIMVHWILQPVLLRPFHVSR